MPTPMPLSMSVCVLYMRMCIAYVCVHICLQIELHTLYYTVQSLWHARVFEFLSKLDSTEKERQAKEAHSRVLLQEEIESMMVQQGTYIVVRMETFQSHTDFATDIIASRAVTMKRWTDIYGKKLYITESKQYGGLGAFTKKKIKHGQVIAKLPFPSLLPRREPTYVRYVMRIIRPHVTVLYGDVFAAVDC
jgi:hypothetical protein